MEYLTLNTSGDNYEKELFVLLIMLLLLVSDMQFPFDNEI